MEEKNLFKAGYVAIAGEPNVGKSTLLNALLGQKISIVTNKPQTTRQRVTGILSRENAQIIFLDTPGLLKPKYLLHKEMIKHADVALQNADIVIIVATVAGKGFFAEEIRERLLPLCRKKPVLLAINKTDMTEASTLASAIARFEQEDLFKEVIPISALKEDNIETLIHLLIKYLPEHEAFYPPDIVSEHPERFFVAEFMRERLFEQFREEIPYSTAVEVREFKERQDAKTFIAADIIVERESQKGIVIGKKGAALKELGTAARKIVEDFLQREVFLDIHVKVREKWRESESMMRKLGYTSEET